MKTSQKYFSFLLFTAIAVYATIVLAGAPLKGIDVKLGKNPGGSPDARLSATTDAEGKFTIANVPPGTYSLYCSYAACARAINTKGNGQVARIASPQFSIEIEGADGLTVTSAGKASAGSTGSVAGKKGNDNYKTLISQDWSATTPGLSLTVSGKSKDMTGHITLLK